MSKEIIDKATAFTILANEYLEHATLDQSWNNRQEVVTIWLMTEEGPYPWQVPHSDVNESVFKDFVCAANEIISDLRNSEERLKEDLLLRCDEIKL